MRFLKKILFLLNPSEKKRAGMLLVMIIIMAILDMIGIASILPFIAVLSNFSLIESNFILNTMFKISKNFGIETNQQFFVILGIIMFIILVISLLFKAIVAYVQFKFVQNCEYSIGKRLSESYLHQSYSWFLNRNSSEIGKNILSEVQQVVANCINPTIELIAKGTIIIALLTLLILVNLKITLIIFCTFGFAYGLIFYFARKFLYKIGTKRLINNQSRFSVISEAFGAIKAVKVGSLEKFYIQKFSNSSQAFTQTTASSQLIAILPRFILEAIVFGIALLIILYVFVKSDNHNNFFPLVSIYVFAGYRLMPAFQQVYTSFTQLTFANSLLNKLYNEFKNSKYLPLNQDDSFLFPKKNITLKKIYYNYPNSSKIVLKDLSLIIPARSFVGIVGATGSGKTTIVDIILGLLKPQKGTIDVDGKVITKQNLRSWQRSIGYAPQHIYLSDDTVAANIALGVEPKDINKHMIKKAAKIAKLHEFVMDELPKQYQTIIGEHGVRLSGGQRQRIGIARALYNNPRVLILDEATNAIDNQTEKAIINSISYLSNSITVILISHHLKALNKCKIIFKFKNGILTVNKNNFI
jgi:ABC-type multidrug transport system fused ATPase/permease subunit